MNSNISKKILVVEDDKSYQDVLSKKLKMEGYDVVLAQDGEVAIEIIKKQNVDLILLDLMMPNMDGFMFYYKMRKELNKDIPTIVITNLTKSSYQEGISDFLVKANTSIDELVELIGKRTGKVV